MRGKLGKAYLFSTAFDALFTAAPALSTALPAALSAASAFAVTSLPVAALTSVDAVFSTAVSFAALFSALFLLHAATPSARTATVTIASFFMSLSLPKKCPWGGHARARRCESSGQGRGNSDNLYRRTRDYFERAN